MHSQIFSWTETPHHIQKKNIYSIGSKSQLPGLGNAQGTSRINVQIQVARKYQCCLSPVQYESNRKFYFKMDQRLDGFNCHK